jgi:NAD(P)-dependent dehydrogenase (short-subunit alcohol dehydrogenase family)
MQEELGRGHMPGRLDGKVAVITGGASGIGRATAERFVAEGASVVVGDIADEHGADLEAALGPDLAFHHADVTFEDDIASLVDLAVERFGRLDIMFNNAGTGGGEATGYQGLDTDGFERGVRLLLRAVVLGHKHAARIMADQRSGSIISTASVAGHQGGWSRPSYDVSKGAIYNLVRSVTAELAPLGIRSNAIAPGIIVTPLMGRAIGVPADRREAFLERLEELAARRASTGDEVAAQIRDEGGEATPRCDAPGVQHRPEVHQPSRPGSPPRRR